MEPNIALSYGPLIAQILSGQYLSEKSDKDFMPDLTMRFITKTGNENKIAAGEMMREGGYSVSDIYDEAPKGSIAMIPLKGPMMKEDDLSYYGTETLSELLKAAASHKNIIGGLIDGDTGGGAVDSIPPMLDAISFARQKMPVGGIGDLIASAGYYMYSHLDFAIAGNDISSEWGSVGVMISFMDLQPYYEMMGVKFHTIYAPESNYKNLPFEKALKGDYELIQTEELSPLARKFQSDVRKARKGKLNLTVPGILNGRMFFASDAVKYGLADEIGNYDLAIKRVTELSKK